MTLTQEAVLSNASYVITTCRDCNKEVAGDPRGKKHGKFMKHHRKHNLMIRLVQMKSTENAVRIFAA